MIAKPEQTRVQAPPLDPRVAGHPERDQAGGQDDDDDRDDQRAAVRPEEVDPCGRTEQGGERLEELELEDRAVDRRPHRQDEPPAGGRQDEADAAAESADQPPARQTHGARDQRHGAVEPDGLGHQVRADRADDGTHGDARRPIEDAALPDVVAAGPRHHGDEARVGHRQERHRDGRENDRQDGRCPGYVGEYREAVEHPERDEVHRHERVGERVETRPALDQAGRVTQEQ